jgi:hypothetical protein
MAQTGWRLPDDLLRRVRVRCAEEGVRQNAWVERALEAALKVPELDSLGPSPSLSAVKGASAARRAADEVSGSQFYVEGEFERAEAKSLKPPVRAKPKPAALGKGLVASRPKGK